MNIEETKKAIEVMQAFVDGKTVQHFSRALGWLDFKDGVNSPSWCWDGVNYRIKPEPKDIWVNEYDGYWGTAWGTKEEAENGVGQYATRKAVRYREVIEE